jgi:hypothetical protein
MTVVGDFVVDCSWSFRLTGCSSDADEIGKGQKGNHSFFCDVQSDWSLMEPLSRL